MTHWVGTAVGPIGAILAAVVAFGGIVAYLRSSWDKGAIAGLEKYKEVADARMAQMETEAATKAAEVKAATLVYEAKIDALEIRVKALEQENAELKTVRPSAEAIAEVMAMQQVLHEQITAHDTEVHAFMRRTQVPGGGS